MKAREKYGADVDKVLAEAAAVRKAVQVTSKQALASASRAERSPIATTVPFLPRPPALARPRCVDRGGDRAIGAVMIVLVSLNVVLHLSARTWRGRPSSASS